MNKQNSGLFISIDGPNGVGKSTLIRVLSNKFESTNTVTFTKEPTSSQLGQFAKENEGNLYGLSYAYLISSDRCYHVEKEIIPCISSNKIIISNRYIDSSIVFQCFEGITMEIVWDLNKYFPIPNLSVLLLADEKTIDKRLSERKSLSSFERRMKRSDEIQGYMNARNFLMTKGFNYITFYNNTIEDLEKNVDILYQYICEFMRNGNEKAI